MNTNKKYAIRKLAVGVASVSIGLFVNNAINDEITTNVGIVGNVAHASESKVIYSNPNPNGDVDAEGTSNNAISKIEVLNETAEKIRLKISIADDFDILKGFKISISNNLEIPFNEVLSFNGEKIGQISNDSPNKIKKPESFQTIDEYYNYLNNLDLSSVSIDKKIAFNDNFKKYNKNRYIEFDVNKVQDKNISLDLLTVKNEIPNEKLQKIIDWKKQLQGVLYLNNKKIHTSDLTTNVKIATMKTQNDIEEIKYDEKKPLKAMGGNPIKIEKTPSYFRLSGVYNITDVSRYYSYNGSIESYIDGKGKNFLKAGTKLRLKLNSNVLTFSNDNKEGDDVLYYSEIAPQLKKTSEIFNGEQILKAEKSNNNKDVFKTIKTHYKKIDKNTYEIEILEDVITENNSLSSQYFNLKDLLYRAEFKDDFLNYLDLNEYKRALQDGSVGKLFGTSSLEIKKPEDTNYTMISKHEVLADPSTSYTFGESSRGTVKVKYVNEDNKEISSLETIAENQPWYNKYEIPKKDIPGYEYISASQPLVDLIMSGEKVVTLTYRSVEKTREIPFNTIYQEDPTKDKGYKETIVKGATGIEGYKDSDSKYKRIIKEKTDEIVKVGTKSTTVTEKLLSPVRYEKDSSREKGQENITVKGKDGSKTTTTTYTVNAKTGEVVSNVGKPVVVEPTETVVKVAAKDKIKTRTLHYGVNYERDDKVAANTPNILKQEGVDGKKITTTSYTVNTKTGEILESNPVEKIVEPKTRIEVVGTKPEDIVTTEKFKRTYIGDETKDKGVTEIVTSGVDGKTVVKRTYSLPDNVPVREEQEAVDNVSVKYNYEFNVAIPHDSEPVVTPPVNEVVKVGTKPVVVYIKEGNKVVKITTTYTVNSTNGGITDSSTRETISEDGAKDKVVTEKLASPIKYEKDSSREKGQENITIKGKDGSKTTTTTYTVNDKTGEVVPNVGKPAVVNPTETVVKVAAKDKIVYSKDGNNVIKETTTYNVNSKTGEITEKTTREVFKENGAKDKVSTEKLPSLVRYEKDGSREKGQENITIKGKDGSKTTTTTYTVNDKTGEVVPNVGKPVVVEPTETVVKVAAKDKIVYSKEGNNVVKETTTYNVNPKTGEITEKTTREVFKENGAKDKVSVEKLPSPVRYEKDGSREKGQENITIKGKDGSKTTTTTYTVNDKTGEVVENVGKPVVVNPTETVVKVAAKDKVSVEKLISPVRYEKDTTREKGQENITVKGKDGSKTTTTTYTVNEKTGEVVENVGKPVVVNPTETVVKVATKDKVVVEKLPSPVRYEKDNSREKGQENITIKGKDGSKTTTTTYTVNPKTGEVVPNVGKSVVVESTETVVKVAAKDKVEVVNKKDGETIKITTSYEVNPKTGEIKEVKKEDLLSKKGIPEVSEESTDFKGGVNPTESIVREDLPELKVALIKDGDGNVLEVIKEDEEPKEIKGYKNTGKTEVDKDGYKVYIYEKEEPKVDKNTPAEPENKVVDKKEKVNKEVINKKEELPKTSTSMLPIVGLFSIFGLRKNKKKDKK